MTAAKKSKLCWNCEGVVDRSAENCIYCGVYLHPEEEATVSDSPPYSPPPAAKEAVEPVYQPEAQAASILPQPIESTTGVLSPILFLMAGSLLLLFGVILFLFARDGIFVLKWNATYWYLYLLLSLPLLYFGWRSLQRFEEK